MSQANELLAAVLADPDSDEPRLVYADYLMEQGDPRGEFIQVQIQLRQKITPARRRVARKRERELRAEHKFGADEAKLVSSRGYKLRRGFIDEITATGSGFAKGAADLLAKEPVRYARLTGVKTSHLKKLVAAGVIGRLAGLRLSGELDLAPLAESEQLQSLRRLNLSGSEVDDAAISALVEGGNLRLESLTLNDTQVGDSAIEALASSESMKHLKRLFASRTMIGDAGAVALARSPHVSDMVVISLGGNEELGEEGAQAFADPEVADRIGRLEIQMAEFGDDIHQTLREVWGDRFRE